MAGGGQIIGLLQCANQLFILITTKLFNTLEKSKKNLSAYRSLYLIGALFFVFGFITWLNSVLIPYLKIACQLNNLEAYFVAFSFYISYFTMAIPSGKIIHQVGYKKGMALGLSVMAVGAMIFIPAALTRTYSVFLLGLFIQGTGLTLLQTAANPYITILGPIESAAKRISVMGICNKIAGALAPIVLGAIALKDTDKIQSHLYSISEAERKILLDELSHRVILPYVAMSCVLVALTLVIYRSGLPDIDTSTQPSELKGSSKSDKFQSPQLLFGIAAMFFYVGAEVIAGDTIINFGASQGIPLATAKFFTSLTLCSMLVGYLIGIFCVPRFLNQDQALKISALTGLVLTIAAVCSKGSISVFLVALLGLPNAMIFPTIWPKAISGMGAYTKQASSYLVMAISGGAIIPLIYGWLSDKFSLHLAYAVLAPCYLVIFLYGMRKFNGVTKSVTIS